MKLFVNTFYHLCIVIFLLSGTRLYALKPLAGVTGVIGQSPRTMALASLMDEHLNSVCDNTGIFSMVTPRLLRQELQKFNCLDEKCILRFAHDAEIKLVITGSLEDNGEFFTLKLHAYGTDVLTQGRLIYKYYVEIPMTGKYGSRELSYIAEEHSGIFISRLLDKYQLPLHLSRNDDGSFSAGSVTGKFTLFRFEQMETQSGLGTLKKTGTVTLKNGKVTVSDHEVAENDLILLNFKKQSKFLKKFYYERKHEIVFKKPRATDTLITILLSGPASATMPLVAPIFGYYWNSDWLGLSLWALSSPGYLYLEINGLTNYYTNYHKKKKTVPQDVRTQHYFAYYMLAAGGLPFFVDAFANTFIKRAANYQGVQRFMGNSFTAGFLSLVSGGGGLFYRGQRLWGHLYFHVNNVLLYFMIREFSPEIKYNIVMNSFETAKINKTRAYALLSVVCVVKVAEVVHAVLSRDKISNGKVIEEGHSIEPVLFTGDDMKLKFGLQYSYRF